MWKILWKREEIAPKEQFLLLSTIFCYLMLDFCVKTRIRFSLRDKRLFEITEVEITMVDCASTFPRRKRNQSTLDISNTDISILFYSITLEGRRGTNDEFATIPFHLVLFSAALVELAKSKVPCNKFHLLLSRTTDI